MVKHTRYGILARWWSNFVCCLCISTINYVAVIYIYLL